MLLRLLLVLTLLQCDAGNNPTNAATNPIGSPLFVAKNSLMLIPVMLGGGGAVGTCSNSSSNACGGIYTISASSNSGGMCNQAQYYSNTYSTSSLTMGVPVGSAIVDQTPQSTQLLSMSLYADGSVTNNGGTLYSMQTDSSSLNILHYFSKRSEGSIPVGALVQNPYNYRLYGLLQLGPNDAVGGVVYGYNIGSSATFVVDWSVIFNSSDSRGCTPYGTLLLVGTLLYGTHSSCGDAKSQSGTVFTVDTTNGNSVNVLHTFGNTSSAGVSVLDGRSPQAPLMLATNGNIYGSTTAGGTVQGVDFGTLWQLDANNTFSTIYSFGGSSNSGDGAHNYAGLLQGTGSFINVIYGGK